MQRPSYLGKYTFDWELFEVIVGGKSALDAHSFLGPTKTTAQVKEYIFDYGFDQEDLVLRAELFGIFQESVQFIRRYFLREGNPDGLEFTVPSYLSNLTELTDLFKMATGNIPQRSFEEYLWAGMVLKVMHTILHLDNDLRSNYFNIIQQQIFDRFYKHIARDENGKLYLGHSEDKIFLRDFQTKSKKGRDSMIIKLLHKPENVAEDIFDRIGLRIITESRMDTLRVIKFLNDKHIIIPHNIKPSRSLNSLIDLRKFRNRYFDLIKQSIRQAMSEKVFSEALEKICLECSPSEGLRPNKHTNKNYQSIQFTCRQLIQYKNPFFQRFAEVRTQAKKERKENPLAEEILSLDMGNISKDIRFFYPFEVQVVDYRGHVTNNEGEASHAEYKKIQLRAAMLRLFRPLLDYKKMNIH